MGHIARTHARRISRTVALGAALVMATAGVTMAGLDRGELPVAGFTHTSLVDDIIEPQSIADIYASFVSSDSTEGEAQSRPGVALDMSGPIAVVTTYTLQPAGPEYEFGWRYNIGPVIFTVTAGTLTFVDDTCQTFDLVAGHTYIASTGQRLDVVLLPEKNPGVAAVGWFTTRLFPEGVAESIEVDAPCTV
jgi:hypothetical protein